MSDEGPDGLSRRQILAAATATGALGAVGTGGTGAFFTDSAEFTDNTLAAGTLDLEVCWESDGSVTCPDPAGSGLSLDMDSLSPGASGTGTISVSVPDRESANPAWLWARSVCPTEDHACGLGYAVKLDLWYDLDCDGGPDGDPPVVVDGTELTDVSLCRVRKLLAGGLPVDARPGASDEEIVPFQPGTEVCIGVSWQVTDTYCPPSRASLPLDFKAVQRRHNPDPSWPSAECEVTCGEGCNEECYPASFITFCQAESGKSALSKHDVEHLSWTEETITFRLQQVVDSVVLYAGGTFEVFDLSEGESFASGTSHQITVGESSDTRERDSKDGDGLHPSEPCPDAGCGLKYNFELSDGESSHWEQTCGGRDD